MKARASWRTWRTARGSPRTDSATLPRPRDGGTVGPGGRSCGPARTWWRGFPFATKLRTAARRGAVVVVNLSEGEPASHKDEVLAMRRPHLILDGAVLAARALGARRVHLVLPGDKPMVSTRIDSSPGRA